MNQFLRVPLKFFAFVLLGFLLILVPNKAVISQDNLMLPKQALLQKLPSNFQSCLPEKVIRGRVWSSLYFENERYFFLGLDYSDSDFVDTIFQDRDNTCLALTPLKKQGVDSLLRYQVDRQIVLGLTLKKYQNMAQKVGGVEQLETSLIESHFLGTGHDEIYYSLEEILALKELGINIPPNNKIFIVAPEGIYGFSKATNNYELIRRFN